jgi:pimeloyl-ACP methyl ester carboxylesterase
MYFPDRDTQGELESQIAAVNLQPWPSSEQLQGFVSKDNLTHPKGTILVFHGNAGSAVHRTYYLDALQILGYRVILAEYPGYGTRTGSPSEESLIKDGIVTAKLALDQFKEPLYLCGESMGSGVVSGIAASGEIPVKGLLLITPFDSMAKVAQQHYWYFLARWLILDKYDNLTRLKNYQGSVAVVLAELDAVVPNQRTMALFDGVSGRKKLWRFENAGHNTLPMRAGHPWWAEVMQFLDH